MSSPSITKQKCSPSIADKSRPQNFDYFCGSQSHLKPIIYMSSILRVKDIRAYFGISTATVSRWVSSGKLPEPEYINNQRIWKSDDIEEAEKKLMKPSFKGKVH